MGFRVGFFLVEALVLVVKASGTGEHVWLQDVNYDHDRRHLDAGLPVHLEFNIRRDAGKSAVKLTLTENQRLNVDAPVFEGHLDENGGQRLVKKTSPVLKDVGFYQDRRNGGAFAVKCSLTRSGPCQRSVDGFLAIDGSVYTITPSPETLAARNSDLKDDTRGLPHFLEKRNVQDITDAKLPPPNVVETFDDVRDANSHVDNPSRDSIDGKTVPTFNDGRSNTKLPDTAELMRELKEAIDEDLLQNLIEKLSSRKKRATNQMACEIVVAVDTEVWDTYYALTSSTASMTRDQATELRIRTRFYHVMNGVSVRYESIDDPDYDIYLTVSGWIMYKTRDSSNPLPLDAEVLEEGIMYAEADIYIDALRPWALGLSNLPHNDHIMVFTGYDLYATGISPINASVAGKAWVGGVCGEYRLSVVENLDYLIATSVAAHELGHNLGSWHDGSSNSPLAEVCSENDAFVMAPSVVLFTRHNQYTVNPWRFSQCSVDQFKDTINSLGSNCMLDHGDYYDVNEWNSHQQNLPGELYDADTQCRLLYGDSSSSCTNTESERICLIMKCQHNGMCYYHTPARGTPCGTPTDNKYCIQGKCVAKSSNHNGKTAGTAPATTVPPSTIAVSTAGITASSSCVDVGSGSWTCPAISDYFYQTYTAGPDQWCWDPNWGPSSGACCAFCVANMK